MKIKELYDESTYTLTYIVWDERSGDAVVVDPVLNYDVRASRTSTRSVEQVANFIEKENLKLHWVLETHAHADHMSGGQFLKEKFGAKLAIGKGITKIQKTFQKMFNLPPTFAVDGSQFDKLVVDGERLTAGSLFIEAIATPGHTPACLTYQIEDAVFTGDALFMHDYGTGRTDFPEGSATALYHSVHERLYGLPDATRVFVGHDYLPNGRELQFQTTIGESKRCNPQLNAGTTEEDFVKFRNDRDATLRAPQLIFQSIQVNVNAGLLPEPAENGQRYLTVPLNYG